jgi:hypothetical protein
MFIPSFMKIHQLIQYLLAGLWHGRNTIRVFTNKINEGVKNGIIIRHHDIRILHSRIIKLITKWKWVFGQLRFLAALSQANPCDRKIVGPQIWSVHYGRETVRHMSAIQIRFEGCAACRLFLLFIKHQFISLSLSLWLHILFGPWPLFEFLNPIHSRQGSLDGGSARRKAATYIWQHKHRINVRRHTCLERDSNLRSQCSSGRRRFLN